MHGQGNYGPQYGQNPRTPMMPFQHHGTTPPPTMQQPQLQFQQGPSPMLPPPPPRPPTVIQQAASAVPSTVPRGPPVYHHPPAHLSTIHQGPPPQGMPHGMMNAGQAYLHPPAQNVHNLPPPAHSHPIGSSVAGHPPEMLRPPPPPRVLPPPPSQGMPVYRMPGLPSLAVAASTGQQQIPTPAPQPSTSGFLPSVPTYRSFVHPTSEDVHTYPVAPPPLPPPPSPPPPLPPSPPPPPPPISPPPSSNVDSSSHKFSVSEAFPSKLMDGDHLNPGPRTSPEGGSLMEDGLPSDHNVILDLPPPPPKPAEGTTVQRIEVLCQFISKNGPSFEDMARKKEFTNPKFEFLFGGEPGSEAAVAHKYFLWMKRKYNLECKILARHEPSNSLSRPSDFESPRQANRITDACESHSLFDSDMDMEDDMIEPDQSQGIDTSLGDQNQDFALVHDNVKEQLQSLLSSAEHSSAKDVLHGKVSSPGSPGLLEQGKGSENFADCDSLTLGGSSSIVCDVVESLVINAEFPGDNVKRPVDSSAPAVVADAGVNIETFADPLVKDGNPFLLLQGYASDDSLENDDALFLKDAIPQTVSASVTNDGVASLQSNLGSKLETDTRSTSPGGAQKRYDYESPEHAMASTHSMLLKSQKSSSDTHRDVGNTVVGSAETEKSDGNIHENHEDQKPIDNDSSHAGCQQIDALDHGVLDVPQSDNSQKEDIKPALCLVKVDEFGRVARDDANDSDSEDSRYTRRRSKRDRSWSRSRSPSNRRGRSPWRRKNRRSLSHSWSPKKRRSRSRSPSIRHRGSFLGDKLSKDKSNGCFDFLRGRCYRGASCRFSHHQNSDKDAESRRCRNKELFLEDRHRLKKSDFQWRTKNISVDKSFPEHNEVRGPENQCSKQISGSRSAAPAEENFDDNRKDEFQDESEVLASHFPSQPATGVDFQNSSGETTENAISSVQDNADQQGEPYLSDQKLQNDENQSLPMNVSSLSDSSPDHTSEIVPNPCATTEPDPNKISSAQPYPDISSTSLSFSSQALGPEGSFPQSFPANDFSYRPQLFPTPPPPSQVVNPPYGPHPVRDHIMEPSTVNFAFQSAPAPYQAPLPNQHSQFALPNSSWTSLPPPPPPPPPPLPAYTNHSTINAAASISVIHSEYQQNHLPPRNDFTSQTSMRSYPTGPHSHSQFAELTYQGYPSVSDPPRLPMQVGMTSSYGGPSHTREDRYLQRPVKGLIPPSSSSEGSLRPQTVPFSGEAYAVEMQSIPAENMGSGGLSNLATRHHAYSEQHRVPFGSQHFVAGSLHVGATSRYPDTDRSQLTYLADIGGSRFSAHHNPFASTFEQPLNSKFSSSVRQENTMLYSNKNDDSFGLSNVPVDGHRIGSSFGSRKMVSSPNSRGLMPGAVGDQYDPLFDSIEPSSNSLKEYNHVQMQHSANNSGIISRPNPYDKEENKEKEVGSVADAVSLENDEFGETADAEVGAVENGSPSDPIDLEDAAAGDIEIDQFRSPGKSKDSRSMKLFKSTLANFVKEVLKPSWRQGNMSKEAFKTIVKKTVDKVSGAMKGHRIPKSQAKIDHYIASSQRKLTKLVMGYVDKFVKV